MGEFTQNSLKSNDQSKPVEKKEIQKVVTGSVKKRKPNELKKFASNIVSEDASKVKDYIMSDVIIPAVKDVIHDVITKGIEIMLWGKTGHKKSGNQPNYKNYSSISNSNSYRAPIRTAYSFENIELETRGEAEAVISQMEDIVENYGMVSVADLYEMVGVTGSYTDNKYGWTTNIHQAQAVRVSGGGYLLKLPRPVPID